MNASAAVAEDAEVSKKSGPTLALGPGVTHVGWRQLVEVLVGQHLCAHLAAGRAHTAKLRVRGLFVIIGPSMRAADDAAAVTIRRLPGAGNERFVCHVVLCHDCRNVRCGAPTNETNKNSLCVATQVPLGAR